MLRHAIASLACALPLTPGASTATAPPNPSGWHRTESFESILRNYQTRHTVTTGGPFAFSPAPNKPPPGDYPPDGYYAELLSTYTLQVTPESPLPSMVDGMYAGLFLEGGNQYWTGSISHRFITPQAFDSLMDGELAPDTIFSRTVAESDPPPQGGYLQAKNTVSYETKIDMIAERLARLRYYLKPLPAAEVLEKSSGRIDSNSYRFTVEDAVATAIGRWRRAEETPVGNHPSPYLRTYVSKENVLYARSLGRYYANIRSYRVRYEADLTGIGGTAYAFLSIGIAPGSGTQLAPGDITGYAPRFLGAVPDGNYYHFATRPAGGVVSFPWVSTGTPFSGADEPRNLEFRVSTEGEHRENYPDGKGGYGPFTIVDLGADPGQILGEDDCEICPAGMCVAGTAEFENNSVDATFSLGPATHGTGQGQLCLKLPKPLPGAYEPSMLEIRGGNAFGSIADADTGQLAQFYGPDTIVDITDRSTLGYTLVFHQRDGAWTRDVETGLYEHAGTSPQIASIRIENPDGSGDTFNRLVVTRTGTGTTVTYYAYDPPSGAWSMTSENGELTDALTVTEQPGSRTESRRILDSGETLLGETSTTTGSFDWGSEVVEYTVGTGDTAVTTSYSYYTDQDGHGTAYGKICQSVRSDGSWVRYHYEPLLGRLEYEISGYGDLPPPLPGAANDPRDHLDAIDESRCHVRRYIHPWAPGAAAPDTLTTIESVDGVEVSRKYTTRTWGQTVDKRCATAGAAYAAPDNQTTTTTSYLDGEYAGLPKRISHPNGTLTLFNYSVDGSANRVRTVRSGAPNADATDVVDGTATATTTNPQGHVIRTRITDVRSSLVIQDDQAVAADIDTFGRPTTTTHLGGLQSSIGFDCCGITSNTDRYGTTTSYAEDVPVAFTSPLSPTPLLLQAETQTTAAAGGKITTATARDGRFDYSLRIGTDGTVVVTSITESDTAGRVVRRIVPVGNDGAFAETTITEAYTAAGDRTITTTGPDGATRIETFYLDGRLKSLTGSAVQPHRFEYGASAPGLQFSKQILLNADLTDSDEWVKTTTGMLGETVKVERGSAFAPGEVSTESYHYDERGRLVSETDADGVTVLYAYDRLGRRDTVALDRNSNRQIDYDGTDRITKTRREIAHLVAGDPTSPVVSRVTTLAWQTDDQDTPHPVHVTEQALGGLESWTTVHGQTTGKSLTYDGSSWSETTLRPDGSYIVRSFAENTGLTVLASETLFGSSETKITSTANTYDAHGRLSSSTEDRNGGLTTTFTYYDSGHLASKTAPPPGTGQHAAQTTGYTYDDRGKRDIVTLPDGGTVDDDYSPAGQLLQTRGAHNYHVTYEYDHRGRVRKMHTRPGTDHQATTEWTYHPQSGLLAQKIAPGGNTTSYAYTPAGRLAARTNGRGNSIAHSYLPSGELAAITYDDDLTHDVAFTYQRGGAIATRSDAAGVTRYNPETGGAYAGSTTLDGILDQTSVTPAYDDLGRRTRLGLTAGTASMTTGFTYDELSRLRTATRGSTRATQSFRPGQLAAQGVTVDVDGKTVLTRDRTTDNLGRILTTTTIASDPASPVSRLDYTYNAANQRTSATLADGSRWTYAYDGFTHLTDATKYRADPSAEPFLGYSFDYAYDGLGNRAAASTSGQGLPGPGITDTAKTTHTPALGDNSQTESVQVPGILTVSGEAPAEAAVTVQIPGAEPAAADRQGTYFHHVSPIDNSAGPVALQSEINATGGDDTETVTIATTIPAASRTLTYDADGNLTSDGSRTFTWDAENRLRSVETVPATTPPGAPEYRVEFDYDATGRRIRKVVSHRVAGNWTITSNRRFLYDGWNLVAELEGTNSNPKLVRSYIWGSDHSGAEQNAGGVRGLLFLTIHTGAAKGTHAPAYDANGNILALVDTASGQVSADYEYDPFGNLLKATGPAARANPFRFSTKYHDDTTGLVYYGLRYYDPTAGRWISRDPIGEDGGTNLYSFVGNNPTNEIDILGLVLFAFDGTGNDREQSNWSGEEGSSSPTNVEIMYDIYDGERHYIYGVGTREYYTAGNLHGKGTKNNLTIQMENFCEHYSEHPLEPVDIIGFSRGAASARIFSNMIRNRRPSVLIRFLGIFDTVAQMGVPNRANFQFGYNLDVSEKIGLISHAVARNEYRALFPLTSLSKSAYHQTSLLKLMARRGSPNAFHPEEFLEIRGSNFIEKPFVGAHSDIGGGYPDGRNVNALRWMISQGQSVGAPFRDLDFYKYAPKIKQISEPHDSRMFFEPFAGDRVVFPGNR